MAARFFITIDTEEDDWGEYRSSGHSVGNIECLPRLQEIFDRHGAVPTYLVTYPVVRADRARALLRDILSSGRCEVGAHCHPWNTPPFREELTERNSMLSNLPAPLVTEKIAHLRSELADAFGVAPRCFRAGRWGFGPHVAEALHGLGFRVDTSVTPFVDWGPYWGPDYRGALLHPYRFDPDGVLSATPEGSLVEVPATIGFLQSDFTTCQRITQRLSGGIATRLHLKGILDRARVVNFRWLSPEMSNGRDMVALAKTCLRRGCSHLNLSFHSTSLLPGRTPFVRTQADLELFLESIDRLLQFAVDAGVLFSRLSDVGPVLEAGRG